MWNAKHHELKLDDAVGVHFRRPAKLLESALEAFQCDGWPPRIDDPTSPDRTLKQSAKRRLNNLVKRLNKCQKGVALIHFYSDGTGEVILWMLAFTEK